MKLTLGEIYALAKISASYSDFMATLGKSVGIPQTDSRVNNITLEDLVK